MQRGCVASLETAVQRVVELETLLLASQEAVAAAKVEQERLVQERDALEASSPRPPTVEVQEMRGWTRAAIMRAESSPIAFPYEVSGASRHVLAC